MNEIKFTCTSCGQHIQCDATHAGENIPCPSCAMLVRVPQDAWAENATPLNTEPAAVLSDNGDKVSFAPPPADKAASKASSNGTPEYPAPQPGPDSTIRHRAELDCACPVCHAELRISLEVTSRSTGVHFDQRNEPQRHGSSQSQSGHPTMEEREQQIAAAREAHPVSLYPPTKPRLDHILGDDASKREAA